MDLKTEMDSLYSTMMRYDLEFCRRFGDIGYQSLVYIDIIRGIRNCTVGKLAEELGVDKSTASRKVDALVRQGHIVKEKGAEDGRRTVLRLSDDMERAFSEENGVYLRAIGRIETELSPSEIETVCKALRIMGDELRETMG